jgi:hypothetical protein
MGMWGLAPVNAVLRIVTFCSKIIAQAVIVRRRLWAKEPHVPGSRMDGHREILRLFRSKGVSLH